MALSRGDKVGVYEIVSRLGAGADIASYDERFAAAYGPCPLAPHSATMEE